MVIGICTRTHLPWFEEFKKACRILGLECKAIRIGEDDWMDQVRGIDAFFWRVIMGDPSCMAEAHIKIPLIEEMGIPCFPNKKIVLLLQYQKTKLAITLKELMYIIKQKKRI